MRAVVKCPDTNCDFVIDFPQTAIEVQRYWNTSIDIACPHCSKHHLEGFRQLYIQAVLKQSDSLTTLNI